METPETMASDESAIVTRHRLAGRAFGALGVRSFVREQGEGEAVLCMHGVPSSSFLYRKVLAELEARDLRGVAFDLPGLGLAARPEHFDYSWSGLGRFATAAVEELELERFHLVVHDLGGPVGFEMAAALGDRVASLTILNTIIAVVGFRRPWSMQPFAVRGLGELSLALLSKPAFRMLMRMQAIGNAAAVSNAELDAYVDLLKREDSGRGFLKIMRGFERTPEKQALYERVVRDGRYPVQIIWGADDPALRLAVQGEQAKRIAGVEHIHTLPAKHFPQEDQAVPLADLIGAHARLAVQG